MRFLLCLSCLSLAFFFSGCSSDSTSNSTGGSTPVVTGPGATAITTTTFGINALTLNWSNISDATSYKVMYDADGSSNFIQIGNDLAAGTTSATLDLSLHLINWASGQYRIDACDSNGCDSSEVLALSSLANKEMVGYLKASNTDAGDLFGTSVAISGDGLTMAVSATGEQGGTGGINGIETSNAATGVGAVYIYVLSGGVWTKQAYIKAGVPGTNDQFGYSLALSEDGNTLAVGANQERSDLSGPGDNSIANAGAVEVFFRNGTTWSQQAFLKTTAAPQTNDEFGYSVDLSADGNTLAVGGLRTDNVHVFTRTGNTWGAATVLTPSVLDPGDSFGSSVALSDDGNTLAIAAVNEASGSTTDENDNTGSVVGAVYIFVKNPTWSQQAYIKASNPSNQDQFGEALALSGDGNTLAVGSLNEDSITTGVGATQGAGASNSGAVYIYTKNGTSWPQQEFIKASNSEASDNFGASVALSQDGNTLAICSPGEKSSAQGVGGDQGDDTLSFSGAAYVLTRSGTAWSYTSYVKSSNTAQGDSFGGLATFSGNLGLALDNSASRLVVGASNEDSNAVLVGGDQSDDTASAAGAVYIF